MPVFQITAPDGRKFKVTGPEGSTKEQALARIRAQYSAAPKPNLKEQNPAEYDPASPQYQDKYGPQAVPAGENFSAGVGKSFVDTGRGIRQLYANIADAVAPQSPNLTSLVTGQPNTRSATIQSEIDASRERDAPLMSTGAGITGNIAGQAAQFSVPGSYAVNASARLPARLAAGAAFGAGIANTQPVTSDQTRGGNTALGAAGGAAGEGIAAGIGRLAAGSSKKITPEIAALAQKADELGIPLRAEQVTGSRPLAGISAALDAVPFSGRDASRNTQRSAFLRAMTRTFGENSDNVTTAVRSGEKNLGAKYDAVLGKYGIKADNQLLSDIDEVLQAARAELTDQQFGVIQRQVDNILSKVGAGDAIDAQAGYNIKKLLDRVAQSQDSSLAYHAKDLRASVVQALDRSLPPEVAKDFAKTRAQYANLIAVRKLVRPGLDGNVTPAGLANVKNLRGDLRDVADVAGTFLKEPFGNSGTQNRTVGLGLLGALGGGAVFDPTLAATSALTGATVGRTANALLQSPAMVRYQLNGSNVLRRLAPTTNALLPAFGATGAVAAQ